MDLFGFGFSGICAYSSCNGVDSCNNFLSIERLDDIVICAEFETDHLVNGLTLGGEHDYRNVRVLADFAADLPAVLTWEHYIKQNHIGFERVEFNNSLLTVV